MRIVVFAALLGLFLQASPPSLTNPDDPAFREIAPSRFLVRLDTSKGVILLDVERRLSPHGVDRFYTLVAPRLLRRRALLPRRQTALRAVRHPGRSRGRRRPGGTRTIPGRSAHRLERARRDLVCLCARRTAGRPRSSSTCRTTRRPSTRSRSCRSRTSSTGWTSRIRCIGEYGESAGGGIRAGKQDPLFTGGNALSAGAIPEAGLHHPRGVGCLCNLLS